MKVLPPTLREKRRYILLRITPRGLVADERDLYYAVSRCVTQLFGDTTASLIHTATISREGDFLILRCRRGCERMLAAAVATVHQVNDTPVHLETVATSGTLKAIRRRMSGEVEGVFVSCTINGREQSGLRYPDGKIDLIRRDMKGQEVVFLTQDDMENVNATTTKSDGI
ncbi:MAG: ribonuclease P [Methanocalculus sp. MSAO_Arc1]|uniref:Rpp14/Pop5 family protein n=1 Tax=Methanocalculus TaxID=71151 RepID=UPI000FF7D126|nr:MULTISPECIES: Rpp14/Pop5 family protein [unclassified Methanocalculus]MCP1663120.1 ribonuclease P/MRP protein subunit POP5 [Methanocalculus sp. AMF5]RQD81583.1 MAG: ribonuclease P [Methanocalculus sp. MSAO_Arc1]